MTKQSVIHILEDNKSLFDVYHEALGNTHELHLYSQFDPFMAAISKIEKAEGHLAIIDLHLDEGYLWDLLGDRVLPLLFFVVSGEQDAETLRESYRRGAIDYLLKPIRIPELIVKIENFFGLQKNSPHPAGPVSKIHLDILRMTVTNGGRPKLHLTPKETRIISSLLEAPSYTLPRTTLAEHIWGTDHVHVHPKTLEMHIYNLRKKIRDLGLNIENVEMKSYRLFQTK